MSTNTQTSGSVGSGAGDASKVHADRKFYDLPEAYALGSFKQKAGDRKGADDERLLRYIHDNVIGKDASFVGPFGRQKGEAQLRASSTCRRPLVSSYTKVCSY